MTTFKMRTTFGFPVCGSVQQRAPLLPDPLDESRTFAEGEEVYLHPDVEVTPGRPDWVRARITEVIDGGLRVQAVHAFHPRVGVRLIEAHAEFEIGLGQVFAVSVA